MPSWSHAASRLAVAIVVAVSGCQTTGHGHDDASGLPVDRPVREADLLRYRESQLWFPGSQIVRKVGADQTPTRPGEEPNPAYVGAILAVNVSPAQLYQWYSRELRRQGFVPTVDYRPSTQVSGQAWEYQRRLQVQVGVFEPTSSDAGTLVYEMILVGYAPGLPRTGS